MKNIFAISSLVIVTVVIVLLQSCSAPSEAIHGYKGLLAMDVGGVSAGDILANYDTTGAIGIITIHRINRSSLDSSGGSLTTYDGTVVYGDALFVDGTRTPADISDLTINAGEFAHIGLGSYAYPTNDLDAYYNSTYNKIRLILRPDTTSSAVFDSVQFESPAAITNLTRGQSIARHDSITLTWNGSTYGEYARIGFLVRYPTYDTSGVGYWAGGFVPNSGGKTFKLSSAEIHLGLADASVCKYQVHVVNLPNSKKVFLISATESIYSVYIVN